ncbi:MAG TPA: hypothetical protein VE777_04255 [Gaiellales bacterium]|nr:hypothetical protein [Gaiellales bacterium]
MTRVRRPVAAAAVTIAALAGAASAAAFTSSATASQTISSRTLGAPSGLTATPAGHNVSVSWTAGSNGSAYAVDAAANGTSSSCAGASWASLTATAGTSLTDAGRYIPQGTYECYRVTTTYGTWSSATGNPTVAVQIGIVASRTAIANGSTAGKLSAGDSMTVTFNQAITPGSGPLATDTVCTDNATDTIMIGVTGSGTTCSTASPTSVGTLTGFTINRNARYSATYAWSAGNTVLTVTIVARAAGSQDPTVSGPGTYTPTTTAIGLLSATGSFHTCSSNTGGGNCTPAATGSF